MKKMLLILLSLLALTTARPSSAAVWSWINAITQNSSTNYDYDFTLADWDENDTTPNPCYGQTACTIFISHKHSSSGTSGTGVVRGWGVAAYPFIGSSVTLGEVGVELKKIFPLPYSGTTNHVGSVNFEECVGFFYAPGVNIGTSTSANDEKYRGYNILPGSICGTAPQPSGSCDFNQDVLTLDHGTLPRQELDGHEVSETVSINCTTSQTLKLYIYSADNVQLRDDGSLYSELYMNDNVLGTNGFTLDVAEQENVVVKSILHTNGSVAAGEFSGSTVMLITVE